MGFRTQRAVRTGTSLWRLTGFMLKFGIVAIVFLVILINAIILSVQEGNITPLIKEVGGRMIIVTYGLNDASLDILSNWELSDFPSKIKLFFILLGEVGFLYGWIKILMVIAAKTPIHGDTSRTPTNFILAVIAFFTLQIFFIMMVYLSPFEFISESIDVSQPILSSLAIPFIAFKNFFLVFPVLIKWIMDIYQELI